jgi:hypothetical protein
MVNSKFTAKTFSENRNVLLLGILIILTLGILYYILFVNKQANRFFTSLVQKEEPAKPQKNYPVLDKKLNSVINAKNPKLQAEKLNLAVDEDKIKTLITLKDESFFFDPTYGKEFFHYGKYIQAEVKFSKLEDLAKNNKIATIEAPIKAINLPPGVNLQRKR